MNLVVIDTYELVNTCPTVDEDIDWVSAKYWSTCQLSANWEYQLAFNRRCIWLACNAGVISERNAR